MKKKMLPLLFSQLSKRHNYNCFNGTAVSFSVCHPSQQLPPPRAIFHAAIETSLQKAELGDRRLCPLSLLVISRNFFMLPSLRSYTKIVHQLSFGSDSPALQKRISKSPVKDLTALVENCKRLLVITGAGASTDSGVPDYR